MNDTSAAIDEAALRARLEAVQERIEAACARAGRAAKDITLIAVSKTFPLAAIEVVAALGVRDFGENKVQELNEKAAASPGEAQGGTLRWHMIGHLQRNKAKDVVATATLFHGLDSLRLARTLDQRAAQHGRQMPCLVQVNVSGEASKAGLAPEAVHPFLDALAAFDHLDVKGLMTLAAPAADPEAVRPQFAHLCTLRDSYGGPLPGRLPILSMGMSGDFEVAIEEGATHIRVGSALFGYRG